MRYTKLHGAGNDFIVINNIEEKLPINKFAEIAKNLCQRRLSIGADGMMVVDKSEGDGDFKMHFYNADGSIGEMCGNGARCIARYAYENGLSSEVQTIEAKAGLVKGWRQSKRTYKIMLNSPTLIELDYNISVDGVDYECSYIELGNPGLPHGVVKYDNLKDTSNKELWDLGNKLRHHKVFPKGANINFYEIEENGEVFVKTFERGVENFTLACGTGSGSVALVLRLSNKLSKARTIINSLGGQLSVEIKFNKDQITEIYLTGPTNIVSEGKVLDEDLVY